MTDYNGGSVSAAHLCVLVHGLWGNPSHMESLAKGLRNQFPEDQVDILVTKRNAGSFTYDGIETGGERVCMEVEEELAAMKARGGNITKLSIVGYSMGGLVARYAVGLLHAKGVLDTLECMNFTAFASPFLGARAPVRGVVHRLFNVLGARTLSESGRQLFLIDNFRNTGRPILSVLADPGSIFMAGLARFKRRTLYSNITNDRTAVYYTTYITKTDPYADLSKVKAHYTEGYEDVILDSANPCTLSAEALEQPSLASTTVSFLKGLPLTVAMTMFIPIGLTLLLGNAGLQSFQSPRRIKLHQDGLASISGGKYHVPLWMKGIRETVEDAYENLNSAQDNQFLAHSDSESDTGSQGHKILSLERHQSRPQEPTLALAPEQFSMIQSLNELGWRKYPVWIHNVRHSHAAIVVRWETNRFAEGKKVIKHWVNEEFLV